MKAFQYGRDFLEKQIQQGKDEWEAFDALLAEKRAALPACAVVILARQVFDLLNRENGFNGN